MDTNLKRKLRLMPVFAFRVSEDNPYMSGLQTKRDLTVREACHIYRNIFLFNIDLALGDLDRRERDEYYKDVTKAMNDFVKGRIGWGRLCEETYCYDDDGDGASVASVAKLVEYLQRKGVV